MKALFVMALIQLTGPGGQHIEVNPAEVSSLREPRGVHSGHFAAGTRCIVIMANGNLISAGETCAEISQRLGGEHGNK